MRPVGAVIAALVLGGTFSCGKGDTAATGAPDTHSGSDTDRDTDADSDTDTDTDSDTDSDTDTDTDADRVPLVTFDGPPPTNILLLTVDAATRHNFGRYSGRDVSPFLDAFADRGVVLEHHRSCSAWTFPSMTCLATGALDADLGYVTSIELWDPTLLPADVPTLASTLRDAGWQTLVVSTNTWYSEQTLLTTGFDVKVEVDCMPAVGATGNAVTFLDAPFFDPARPWFLHVHYFDPHGPYSPPEEYLTELESRPKLPWDVTTSDGAVAATSAFDSLPADLQAEVLEQFRIAFEAEYRYADDQIALLWAELEARGLTDDLLVVVSTDHGQQFFERGDRGHGLTLYREENDSIAYFWASTIQPASWDEPTSTVDLMPTILDLYDIPIPPTVTGEVVGTSAPDRVVPSFTYHSFVDPPYTAVDGANAKLLYRWDGVKELYHRADDAEEVVNIYDPASPEVIALWEDLAPLVDLYAGLYPHYVPVDPAP